MSENPVTLKPYQEKSISAQFDRYISYPINTSHSTITIDDKLKQYSKYNNGTRVKISDVKNLDKFSYTPTPASQIASSISKSKLASKLDSFLLILKGFFSPEISLAQAKKEFTNLFKKATKLK